MLLYADERFTQHETGEHPEKPARIERLLKLVEKPEIASRVTRKPLRTATRDELLRVHGARYLDRLEEYSKAGGGRIDPDTIVATHSVAVAKEAAGTALAAVDEVMKEEGDRRALCLVRPPGHHALADRAMGFCLYNNVALAAAHARKHHKLERVLIVDWDVHHGNGTQDIFYEDGNVFFLSLHRFPFYPGSGDSDETGRGAGLGATLNVPLPFGVRRPFYRDAFARALERIAEQSKPELILLSAGFDAHRADPIGSLGLESEDFGLLTERLVDVAKTHCGVRIVSLLEGGYNLDALVESVQVHIETLLRP
jgi:acetoin utilization deacetylase AcuC-like enzyme